MDFEELSLKATSFMRRTGLSSVPRPALVGIALLCALLLVFSMYSFWPRSDTEFVVASAETADEPASDGTTSNAPSRPALVVDIEGAVTAPGLYELEDGSRIGDAIDAAGGFTADAAATTLNLAQKLSDGEQIVVLTKQEATDAQAGPSSSNASSSAAATGASSGSKNSDKVNINTATADELQGLSGVGPSLSQRIIDYREANGRFQKIEDLQNVSGIGETRFANLKDKICV